MPISVICSCGARLKTKDENAGRSFNCPKCGQSLSVPAAGSAVKAKPKAAEPTPDDLFGFNDEPVLPRAQAGARPAGEAVAEEKLPSRAGYEPMTDAKKKKIAKLAAKVEKSKPTFGGASMGVSLGTVLAIALFGWRIYRVTTKVNRAFNPVEASAEFDPADLKEIAAQVNKGIEDMVNDPKTAEAREWLDAAKHPNHTVMEMGNDRARTMVNGFYDRGAESVYVLEPEPLGPNVITALFAVKLPSDPAKRKECFAWEPQFLEGEEPTKDEGQKYLLISTD